MILLRLGNKVCRIGSKRIVRSASIVVVVFRSLQSVSVYLDTICNCNTKTILCRHISCLFLSIFGAFYLSI